MPLRRAGGKAGKLRGEVLRPGRLKLRQVPKDSSSKLPHRDTQLTCLMTDGRLRVELKRVAAFQVSQNPSRTALNMLDMLAKFLSYFNN
jgi:hypothetical protein